MKFCCIANMPPPLRPFIVGHQRTTSICSCTIPSLNPSWPTSHKVKPDKFELLCSRIKILSLHSQVLKLAGARLLRYLYELGQIEMAEAEILSQAQLAQLLAALKCSVMMTLRVASLFFTFSTWLPLNPHTCSSSSSPLLCRWATW